VARAAAVDDGEWTGAGLAPVAVDARLQATPRRDRGASAAPARGGSAFAAAVSLVIHATIVAAAALSLGAPQPTGAPDAIAVELVASTGETPTPTPEPESTRAAPAPHDEATAPAPDDATPVPTRAPETAAPQPTDASDPMTSATAETPDTAAAATPNAAAAIPTPPEPTADATDVALPSPPPPPETRAGGAPVLAAPPQSASAPPEADFAAAIAAPRVEPRRPTTATRVVARLELAARPPGARAAASAGAPARGAAERAAYRDAVFARIARLVRYPEAARERSVTGVATVRFALDAAGAVTLADLAKSSGDRALDDEAMAAVRRASPLPPPPADAPRAYSAPIRFELR